MRMRVVILGAHLGVALGLAAALTACSSQKNGPGPSNEGGGADATREADADGGEPDGVTDGPAEADGRNDVEAEATAEGGSCTGVICAGACLQATDCRSCPGASLLCGATGTCVATCAGCQDSQGAARPIDCFACDSNHQNAIGTCQPADAGSYCLSGDYAGQYQGGPAYQCGCSAVSGCPGPTQVCIPLGNFDAGFCLTCGETTVGQIQGQPCKDGGTCNAAGALCQ
jgi:hypothetical protein